MLRFAGIKRNVEFSPNHRGNDNEIFMLTSLELEKLGCSIKFYGEDEFMSMDNLEEDYVFTMARKKETVKRLQLLEDQGKMIVNSGYGIENCYRINMTEGLIGKNIPYPRSIIVSTENADEQVFQPISSPTFWIKRGDFHAIHKEDVSFVKGATHGVNILREYQLRNITEAVVSEHLYGDLVKFYGVKCTAFFHWFYPFEFNHSKFNAEAINGSAGYYDFDESLLKKYGADAADALNVDIYGGDAIISPNGDITIIDLNDWPSFAPCGKEASVHIAECIYRQATQHAARKAESFI